MELFIRPKQVRTNGMLKVRSILHIGQQTLMAIFAKKKGQWPFFSGDLTWPSEMMNLPRNLCPLIQVKKWTKVAESGHLKPIHSFDEHQECEKGNSLRHS